MNVQKYLASRFQPDLIFSLIEFSLGRFLDMGMAFALIFLLKPEDLGVLEISAALVAPLFIFFISPELLLYRHYSEWKLEGQESLSIRVAVLRKFCWAKGLLALIFAITLAMIHRDPSLNMFYALVWIFCRSIGVQIIAVDREFARIKAHYGRVFTIHNSQKILQIGGLGLAYSQSMQNPFFWLAVGGVVAVLGSSILGIWLNREPQIKLSLAASHGVQIKRATFYAIFQEFGIWSHVKYVLALWTQTLDLFCAGLLHAPARAAGIYVSALKVANFTICVPQALTSLYSARLSREPTNAPSRLMPRKAGKYMAELFCVGLLQATVLGVAAPLIGDLLSHGRWSPEEHANFVYYLRWLLAGIGIYGVSFFATTWITLCSSLPSFIWRAAVPWLIISFVLYFAAFHFDGFTALAWMNVPVYTIFILLTSLFLLYRPKR